MWTLFIDNHTGGYSKEKFDRILIEAKEAVAVRVFFARFGHRYDRVSCTCCGPDYGVHGVSFEQELRNDCGSILVIHANDIEPHEQTAEIPRQGYVWVD